MKCILVGFIVILVCEKPTETYDILKQSSFGYWAY